MSAVERLTAARAELARRRAAAEAATCSPWTVVEDRHRGYDPSAVEVSIWSEAAQTYVTEDVSVSDRGVEKWRSNAAHIAAAADPVYVLTALDAAVATLDRHVEHDGGCGGCLCAYWPCADAAAVLDLYAPAVTS